MSLLTLDMCWRLLQVIISIDPTDQEETDYWKQHNQEAYSMVEGAADKLQARCASSSRPMNRNSMQCTSLAMTAKCCTSSACSHLLTATFNCTT